MKKMLILFLLLGFTASAQDFYPLKVLRFNASYATNPRIVDNPTIKASQTDTTEWFYFSEVKSTGNIALDTIIEPTIFLNATTDSIRAAFKIQYGVGKGDSKSAAPFTASTNDSLCVNTPGTGFTGPGEAHAVWHRKPAGANCARIIVATGAAGNSFAEKKTYNVGFVFRSR